MQTLLESIESTSLEHNLCSRIKASLCGNKINEATINPRKYYNALAIDNMDVLKIDKTKHIDDSVVLKIYKPYVMTGAEICDIYYERLDRNHLYDLGDDWASEHPMNGWKLIPASLINTSIKYTVIPYVLNYGRESRLLIFNKSRAEMRVLFTNGFHQDKFYKLAIPYKFVETNWLCNVSGVSGDAIRFDDASSIVYDIVMDILK